MKDNYKLTRDEVIESYAQADRLVEEGITKVAKELKPAAKKAAKPGYDNEVASAINKALSGMDVSVVSNEAEDDVIKALLEQGELETLKLDLVTTLTEVWAPVRSKDDIELVDIYCGDQSARMLASCKVPVFSRAIQPATHIGKILGSKYKIAYEANIDEPEEAFEERLSSCFKHEGEAINAQRIGPKNWSLAIYNLDKAAKIDEVQLRDRLKEVVGEDAFFAYQKNRLVIVEAPGLFSGNPLDVKHHGYGVVAGVSCMEWGQALPYTITRWRA